MFNTPENSPWGKIQTCDTLCAGVFLVSTASHGGTMFLKRFRLCSLPPPGSAVSGRAISSVMRKIVRKTSCCGSFWTRSCGKSPNASRTQRRLRKTSTSPSGNTTRNIGGRGRPGLKKPRPGRPPRRTAPNADPLRANLARSAILPGRRLSAIWPM